MGGGGRTGMLGLFLVFVEPIILEVWGGGHVPPRPPPGSAPAY